MSSQKKRWGGQVQTPHSAGVPPKSARLPDFCDDDREKTLQEGREAFPGYGGDEGTGVTEKRE